MMLPEEHEISFIERSQNNEIFGSIGKKPTMISTQKGLSIPLEDDADAKIEQTISSINQSNPQIDILDRQVNIS